MVIKPNSKSMEIVPIGTTVLENSVTGLTEWEVAIRNTLPQKIAKKREQKLRDEYEKRRKRTAKMMNEAINDSFDGFSFRKGGNK